MSEPRTGAMQVFDDQIEERSKRARRAHMHDLIFNRHVQHVVAFAMQKHGPIDPDHASHHAYNIAMEVAALLLKTVYEEDAEVRMLVAERDRFRKLAEDALSIRPPPMFIPTRAPKP